MPSAKETLDKIAQAIGIATAEPTPEVVEETTEVVEDTPVTEEVKETEEVTETTGETVEDKVEDTTEDVTEEVTEEVETTENNDDTEVEVTEEKSGERVAELEAQIDELKKIIADSLAKETEDVVETPEIPVKEEEGLTHSPEAEVAVKRTKIGNKGGSIMSNVFKYINN